MNQLPLTLGWFVELHLSVWCEWIVSQRSSFWTAHKNPFQTLSFGFSLNENFRPAKEAILKDTLPHSNKCVQCALLCSQGNSLCHCIPGCFTDRKTIVCFTQSVITGWNAITSPRWNARHSQCKCYSRNLVSYQILLSTAALISHFPSGIQAKVKNVEEAFLSVMSYRILQTTFLWLSFKW